LGGDASIPEMTISARKPLQPGDTLFLCTDGIWSNMKDADIVTSILDETKNLRARLEDLGRRAVKAAAPFSDNSSAAVLRFLEA
jgi:protein phosphatase